MSDSNDNRMTSADHSLGQALRALPPVQAPDVWAQLARRARTGRRRRLTRIGIPLALAAAVLLAVLTWPHLHSVNKGPVVEASTATQAKAQSHLALPALRQRSQRLQDWVRVLNAQGAPLNGPSLAHATRIEDSISMVDMQLATNQDSPRVQEVLWQERVDLLQQLAAVRLGQTRLVAIGSGAPQLILN